MELVNPMKSSILCFFSATLPLLLLLSASCSKPAAPAPEEPPSRGERDRLMSELHATRKVLLDAIAAVSDEKLKTAAGENQPSPSEAVEALIIRERNLLTAMGGATLSTEPTPAEPKDLSPEQRQERARELAAKIANTVTACVDKIGIDGFRVLPNPAGLDGANLSQGFKATRDANIVFVRETNYSLDRRIVKDDACGDMNLATALMLQSALTDKAAELVKAAGAVKATK